MIDFSGKFQNFFLHYNKHIFIFIAALFLAISFAHPSLLITDEWITVNQLSQLHDGHQLILNEGKYGTTENGTLAKYFTVKGNYLAYPLILPVISLPAYWLLDVFGNNFVFIILYIWTFLLIIMGLMLNYCFKEYSHIGKFRWTDGLFIMTFILFFINLFFYRPFPVSGENSYPEIIAIVCTNIVLFAILSVMVYEICLTIFSDPRYSIFGTVICISCSSYLFWANFCKDHTLIAFIFTAIVFMLVKYVSTHHYGYIAGTFVLTGLLAWARPELGLFVLIVLCIFIAFRVVSIKNKVLQPDTWYIILAPLFTILGAIPFFINNYLFTKNILIPAWILWKTEISSSAAAGNDSGTITAVTSDTFGSLTKLFISTINLNPATFVSDLYGVLLNPQSGSMGLLPLVPLFLVTIFLLPVFWSIQKRSLSPYEREMIIALVLLALGVFLAYVRGISGLNASVGIAPDMRYLSPIYLPLNLLGLLAIRKLPFISDNPVQILGEIFIVWFIALPSSAIALALIYPQPEVWAMIFTFLNASVAIGIFLLVALFLFSVILNLIYNISSQPAKIFLILLCAVPLIWQIDATILARLWGAGLGGYSFWVPIMLKAFSALF